MQICIFVQMFTHHMAVGGFSVLSYWRISSGTHIVTVWRCATDPTWQTFGDEPYKTPYLTLSHNVHISLFIQVTTVGMSSSQGIQQHCMARRFFWRTTLCRVFWWLLPTRTLCTPGDWARLQRAWVVGRWWTSWLDCLGRCKHREWVAYPNHSFVHDILSAVGASSVTCSPTKHALPPRVFSSIEKLLCRVDLIPHSLLLCWDLWVPMLRQKSVIIERTCAAILTFPPLGDWVPCSYWCFQSTKCSLKHRVSEHLQAHESLSVDRQRRPQLCTHLANGVQEIPRISDNDRLCKQIWCANIYIYEEDMVIRKQVCTTSLQYVVRPSTHWSFDSMAC